eukprot:8886784-Pyramimonas_sp.AAC.1
MFHGLFSGISRGATFSLCSTRPPSARWCAPQPVAPGRGQRRSKRSGGRCATTVSPTSVSSGASAFRRFSVLR